jgi:formamidopyrimidine-DNA glycosylase
MKSCLLWERTLAKPASEVFRERIINQEIYDVDRRGKFLILKLNPDNLIIHLRMSGDINIVSQSDPVSPHDRMWLNLEGDLRLAFNDTRKFGRAWLVADPSSVTGKLGPEPLDDDFTAKELLERLQRYQRQLKPLLMDQSFIAGLGNIYTDEALHLAKLHPLRKSNTLDVEQSRRLWSSIRQVLQEGIERQGASIDWVYKGGDFQNYFRVYQRTGDPCPECGQPVQRITVGQRGTHYCQNCQPDPS